VNALNDSEMQNITGQWSEILSAVKSEVGALGDRRKNKKVKKTKNYCQ